MTSGFSRLLEVRAVVPLTTLVLRGESLTSQAYKCDEDRRRKQTRQLRDRSLHSCLWKEVENILESVLEIDQQCRGLGGGVAPSLVSCTLLP